MMNYRKLLVCAFLIAVCLPVQAYNDHRNARVDSLEAALNLGLKSIHPDSTATYSDKDGYMLLTQIYTELGQKDKSRAYMNKVYGLMNRYATDHYQSGLSQMEVLYETEKKEAQIATLDKERSLYRWLFVVAVVAKFGVKNTVSLVSLVQKEGVI